MDVRYRLPLWLLLLNGVLAFAVTVLTLELWGGPRGDLPREELRMLSLVYDQVLREHVQPQDGAELMTSAIRGLVDDLDAYSSFVPPKEVNAFEQETTGRYAGIGIAMVRAVVPVTIHYLFEGGPAERAGLQVGDRILAAGGRDFTAVEPERILEVAQQALLGDPGTAVELRVQRGGAEFDVTVERASVQRPSVHWVRMLDATAGLGYAYVSSFQRRTAAELREAVEWLRQHADAGLRGLILDLRHNPGGLLDECVGVANLFVADGNIVKLQRRDGGEVARHDADPSKVLDAELPLVVLVDEQSASASEVLAGCLQDHRRAVLVGGPTYGKGFVQSIYVWEGLDFRLKLTTSRYVTPNGRSIEREPRRRTDHRGGRGLQPDVPVALAKETAARVHEVLRAASRSIPRRYAAAARALGEELSLPPEAEPLAPADDPQLAAGLEELRQRAHR